MTVVSKLLLLIFALSKFEVARTDCNQSKCFTWRDHKEDFFCEGSAFETYGCYTKKNNVTVELLTYDCSFNIKCFFDDQTPHHCQLNSLVYKFMNSLVNFVFRITDNITNSTTYACINHLKTVKNIPEYVLKANSSEPNRIKVCLSGAGAMASIEPGTFELGYICKECEIKERFPNTNNFFIEDLPYAFYNYSFEFQFRYKGSNYSKTVTKYFKTAAKKPETIPSQEHFLFSLDGKENTGNLFLYWDSLEEKFHNGPGFKYKITKDSGQSVLTYISNIDWGSIPLNKTSIFYLQSCNNIGCSDKNATLLIHPRNPKYELHVWSISISNDFNNYNNYTRFVRWGFPNTAEVVLISNTTIVHTKVPPGFNQHFFKLSKETDLNSKLGVIGKFADCDYSTGIVWDECRDSNKILNNEDIIPALEYSLDGHLRKLRIRLENLECWHKAAIDYIEIEYWEDQILNKNAKNITNLVDEIVLEKLTPFTNYSVKLKVHSSITTFKESEIKNVITLEDFKNPPRNLRLVGSNNTSIQLAWEAPIQVNSSNIKYIVNYNGTRHDAGNEGNFIVNNLDCNKTYEFWITTLGYNNKSNIIYEVLRCCEYFVF
ncbi:DOME family protein [Megaselia abdita]